MMMATLPIGACHHKKDNMTGFYIPEEASPHACTFMQWPVSKQVYSDPLFLEMVQDSIAEIANSIAQFEPVIMLMDSGFKTQARRRLSDKIEIWDIPTDDLWCRDSGPCFVRNDAGDLAIRSFNFNGWGNKQIHENDGQIAQRIADKLNIPLFNNGLVGEPGGLEFSERNTVIAHESSWINDNRNSGTKEEITAKILEAVGAEKLIWATGVYGEDITDYHIDALARYVSDTKIMIQLPDEREIAHDPFAKSAYETYDILAAHHNAENQKNEMIILPDPIDIRIQSSDFVASYVNYYICNNAIIMAQFGDDKADQRASSTLKALFPEREIIALNVDPLGEIGGGIHCATQQMPKI